MFDINKLSNMIVDLKKLECELEEDNWQDEDKIYDYNELQDEILDYLKSVL